MTLLVCREPGCPKFRPCPQHPEPDHRSPSSRRTSTHEWQTRTRPRILARDRYTCQRCGTNLLTLPPRLRQVDHRIPVSKGGTDADTNLIAVCGDCNNRRGNR